MKIPKGWKSIIRESGLVEWICPHGVGHPAPIAFQFTDTIRDLGRKNWGIHGCDGCCAKMYKQQEINQ